MKLESVIGAIKEPKRIIVYLGIKGFFNWLPDQPYLKMIYWCKTGRRLDLQKPLTFNEKLQWLKLYDRNPSYSQLVDKYEVRKYIKESIGEKYSIPLLGSYNSADEINFAGLPDQFVLKCMHDSGRIVICTDKRKLDIKAQKKY